MKEDYYKAKITYPHSGLKMKCEVLRMKDENFCVQFIKKNGQAIDFMNEFKFIRDFCLND